jgi:hypothetical protein
VLQRSHRPEYGDAPHCRPARQVRAARLFDISIATDNGPRMDNWQLPPFDPSNRTLPYQNHINTLSKLDQYYPAFVVLIHEPNHDLPGISNSPPNKTTGFARWKKILAAPSS